MPAKRGAENRLQVGKARLPTQFAHGQRRIGDQHRWIARPPRCLLMGNRSGYHSARLGQNLLHGAALAGAEVRGQRFAAVRSEEHTSELQSLMRNSYAVFCLTKK